ncbi:outer membrane beta-barrel protein [Rapidithrix thailandica]|uniref:Outer membrane beta-barrel protein n=1 Tax=Rapidithrix thailandica TaxID=413964 RepID=A0AAW9S4P8_9BACT
MQGFKKLLIIFLLLGGVHYVKGQTWIGGSGFASASSSLITPSVKSAQIIGAGGGLVFRHMSQKHFGIQLELNYVQKGWQQNFNTGENVQNHIDYLELPMYSHISFGNKFKIFVDLGVYGAMAIRNSVSGVTEPDTSTPVYLYDESQDAKFDFGVGGGGGLGYDIGVGMIQVDVKYNVGLNYVMDRFRPNTPDRSYNTAFKLGISYLIPLGKSSTDN